MLSTPAYKVPLHYYARPQQSHHTCGGGISYGISILKEKTQFNIPLSKLYTYGGPRSGGRLSAVGSRCFNTYFLKTHLMRNHFLFSLSATVAHTSTVPPTR
jgi:hypothetical protein